ncbi:hypothetical protein AHiyo8_01080 [Arthrobacter sp. Hiyo8]|uniref:hypothetical protein n=1 Tax=Arthrobacter sp. Hiyo1 TaxID=1588020 RepID=UPI0006839782|nr:hypothetical protein [Arthrobacter sp. Hiyo1]BAS11805.1 hypothetical protein AHiyo8_01080 [Arthrobacter sp. Hiyo8]GAP61295.1 hypothetical protein AHiyo1_49830 [Arthrobacter sp. Hiyo1]
MFPMTPVQSWATILLLMLLVVALTKIIVDFDAALDRRQAAKRAGKGTTLKPKTELSATPNPIQPVSRTNFDGFPSPSRGEIYDYAVHGI